MTKPPARRTKPGTGNLNAATHGILSRDVVLPHESQAEFSELLRALQDEHQPATVTEAMLVEELAALAWRKRRVLLAEGAAIQRWRDAAGTPSALVPAPSPHTAALLPAAIVDQLPRYETHLARRFSAVLSMLLRLQERRAAQAVSQSTLF